MDLQAELLKEVQKCVYHARVRVECRARCGPLGQQKILPWKAVHIMTLNPSGCSTDRRGLFCSGEEERVCFFQTPAVGVGASEKHCEVVVTVDVKRKTPEDGVGVKTDDVLRRNWLIPEQHSPYDVRSSEPQASGRSTKLCIELQRVLSAW